MRGNAAIQGAPVKFASKLNAPANAAATVNVAGEEGVSHVLVGIEYSYKGAGAAGNLRVTDGIIAPTTYVDVHVTGPGHWSLDFSKIRPMGGIPMPMGEDLQVKLGAGGAGVVAKVSITYR